LYNTDVDLAGNVNFSIGFLICSFFFSSPVPLVLHRLPLLPPCSSYFPLAPLSLFLFFICILPAITVGLVSERIVEGVFLP